MTTPRALSASSITRRLRSAGFDATSSAVAPGVVRTYLDRGNGRPARAALLQAGYEAVATTDIGGHLDDDTLTVTLPEPVEDGEIVRAGQLAPLVEQDAPWRDLAVEALLDEVEARAEQQHADDEADREANAVEPATAEQVADAILDRRPILDLFPSRDLTREQCETVDAGVTLATRRLAARYGVTPSEVIRLGREVVEQYEPVEPGSEVDDPREQPRPLGWDEVAGAGDPLR